MDANSGKSRGVGVGVGVGGVSFHLLARTFMHKLMIVTISLVYL